MVDFKKKISEYLNEPKTVNFLEKLSKKLGPDLIGESLRNQMIQSHGTLNESIQSYFKNYIISKAACKAYYQNPNNEFYLKSVGRYFSDQESVTETGLFDLNKEFVSNALEKKKNQCYQVEFQQCVENNIHAFFKMLSDYSEEISSYDSVPVRNRSRNGFDDMIKHFSSKAKYLNYDNELYLKQPLDKMLNTYYNELKEGISLMMESLDLFESSLQFKLSIAEWYSDNCRALKLKMKVFEADVLRETYPSETIPALKIIRKTLDTDIAQVEEDLKEKNSILQAYFVLGPEYEKLVSEYTKVVQAIEKQQWAIDTLKQQKTDDVD